MPRGGGSAQTGGVYHVISRFVAKEWFIQSAVERRAYLQLLGLSLTGADWTCFCFAVMSSHIHLGLIAGRATMASWMHPRTAFASWMNERRERIGSVFVKGPNVVELRRSGAARLISYVHNNPVRARVVSRPGDSDWTSHRAYVGAAPRPAWLDVEAGLDLAGFSSGSELDAWMGAGEVRRADLDAHRVEPLRRPGRPRRSEPSEPSEPKVETRLSRRRVSFVAGAGFEPATFGL